MTTTRFPATDTKLPSKSSFQSLFPLNGVRKCSAFSISPGFCAKRARCCAPRKSIARWIPRSPRPAISRSRARVDPTARRTAWYFPRSCSAVTCRPTSTPHTKSTPSAWSSSILRCTMRLSSFMLGIPYMSRPPGRASRSSTVTLWPIWLSSSAAARPAGPEPTTATSRPVRSLGIRGFTHPSLNPRSAMAYSMFLIVTGCSMMPSTHAPSHGAGHTRPVNSGKLLVIRRRCSAACQWPS
mmetsp:Transcript_28372/g.59276  ORF Transcript_28372/g.59276 Transcript_28372/m.59276 type:complete len:240 (-) Transcript_28372:5396-6115(-)